jgi:RNA polymerase sigma-70 factor (ECF subfamily)
MDALLAHHARFLAFLERRVQDAGLAEDILQSAYMRAMQHEDALEGQESVVGWFYRVLRNAVIDQYRRRSAENKAMAEWGRELETLPELQAEDQRAVCGCIARVVDMLRPEYAELLKAVELGGQKLQEYARQHGLSPSNARVRAHRARAALRRELIRVCSLCSEHACLDCNCRQG